MLCVGKAAFYREVCAEIIHLLQKERTRRRLSKYAVSKQSGVSQSMLSLVERGLRNPTLEIMLRIADGIGADLPTLIKKATSSVSKRESLSSKDNS